MKNLRKLIKNKAGALYYIQIGIVILIMSALAIPIVGSVLGTIPANTIDQQLQAATGKGATYTPTANVTAIVVRTSGTVLGLNPLAALVAVAAGMISLLVGAFVVARPGGI
jgi:energy-converting hydrogenase Eha subunit C